MEAKSPALRVPSKKAVRRAGESLRLQGTNSISAREAVETLSCWRSLHTYPINTFQAYLRNKLRKIRSTAIIAQRLKRLPSIVGKLQRFPDMKLDRMQDIGGMRVVLSRIADVYALHESLVKTKRAGHVPELPPKDYIKSPKADGYRSLHQVFRYSSKVHPELNGLRIELQLRTQLQHSWATAVETLGIVEKSSFKTGEGDETFKRFFQLSSALFAIDEGQPVVEACKDKKHYELVHELRTLDEKLQISIKLKGLALSAKHIERQAKDADEYHVMELDIEQGRISLVPFSAKQLILAESLYKGREQETIDNPNIFVVLIAAGSIKEIKKAYPNYFLDTNAFIKNLKRISEKYST